MISRQRRWQIRKVKEGLCQICGMHPIYKHTGRCKKHYFPWALGVRIREREKHGCAPWHPAGLGRPHVIEIRMGQMTELEGR